MSAKDYTPRFWQDTAPRQVVGTRLLGAAARLMSVERLRRLAIGPARWQSRLPA